MSQRLPLAATTLLLAFFAACPKPPPQVIEKPKGPPPEVLERQALIPKVAALSKEAEALLKTQDELIWKNWTEGQSVDIAKTYEGHENLFTKENIQAIARLRELSPDPLEQRALSHLHVHFVGEYLAKELSDVTDAIANLEASMTFSLEGKDVPYRDLERLLTNEPKLERRHALYDAATQDVQRLAESVHRKDERIDALLKELGYPSYEAFTAELREVELEPIAALASNVLDVTDHAWSEVLSALVQRELKVPLTDVTRADFPRIFHAKNVDANFPKGELAARTDQTLAGMGTSLAAMTNIRIDASEKKTKNPRPFTVAVVVPSDIRVSYRPRNGARAQEELFHELGHALHDAHSAQTRFEVAKLGDDAVAEAMGDALQDLVEDPLWLDSFAKLSGEPASDFLYAESAFRLFQIRRAAAHVLFERAVHSGEPIDVAQTYSALMSRAYGVPVSGNDLARAGIDREDFFQSADSLRAWFLAGELQGQLKGRFGPSWWTVKDSSGFLKSISAKGNSVTAEEVAKSLGDERIKPDVLLLRLSGALHQPLTMPTELPAVDAGTPPVFDAGTPSDGGVRGSP